MVDCAEELHLLYQKVEDHIKSSEDDFKQVNAKILDLDNRLREIEMSKQKTEFQYEQIMESLRTLNDKTIPKLTAQIQELKDKPVKRYDQAVSGILGAIFGVVGTIIANTLFKK